MAGIPAYTAAGSAVPALAALAPHLVDRSAVVSEQEGESAEEGLVEGLGARAAEQGLVDGGRGWEAAAGPVSAAVEQGLAVAQGSGAVAQGSGRWIDNSKDRAGQALGRVAVQQEVLEVEVRVAPLAKIPADPTVLPAAVSAERLALPTRRIDS